MHDATDPRPNYALNSAAGGHIMVPIGHFMVPVTGGSSLARIHLGRPWLWEVGCAQTNWLADDGGVVRKTTRPTGIAPHHHLGMLGFFPRSEGATACGRDA